MLYFRTVLDVEEAHPEPVGCAAGAWPSGQGLTGVLYISHGTACSPSHCERPGGRAVFSLRPLVVDQA